MLTPRGATVTALVMALSASMTGCGDQARAESSKTTDRLPSAISNQKVAWQPCEDPAQQDFECAKLQVPLNYEKPDGDKIDIALIRAGAADPSQRIGSLVFNFGGPGDPGVSALPEFIDEYQSLGQRYDIVSFDPRGVGQSSGVTCIDDQTRDRILNLDGSPDTHEEIDAFVAGQEEYNKGCAEKSGGVLPHIGTANAARDLDVMREALGDKKLHYFGISYGTWLGAIYAHMFPKHTGRLVLDGAVDPELSPEDLDNAQAASMQNAFEEFIAAEAACPSGCLLASRVGQDREKLLQTVADLLDRLDENPLPTNDPNRPLTQTLAKTGIFGNLGSQSYWTPIDQGISEALDGNGTVLLELADNSNERAPDGTYSALDSANRAIRCVDTTEHYDASDIRKQLPEFEQASSLTGDDQAWQGLRCVDWVAEGNDDAKEVDARGAAPILVAGTVHDPNTPYKWAEKLVKELGNAQLVSLDGEGHGAYGQGKCIDDAINAYLLDGKLPPKDLTCKPDAPPTG